MKGDSSGDDDWFDESDRSAGNGSDEDDGLGRFRLEDIVNVLSHSVRRRVLTCLDDADEELSLDELATGVEQSGVVGDVVRGPVGPTDRLELRLYHVHLPKLADEGLVAFDDRTRTVSITAEGEEAVRRLF